MPRSRRSPSTLCFPWSCGESISNCFNGNWKKRVEKESAGTTGPESRARRGPAGGITAVHRAQGCRGQLAHPHQSARSTTHSTERAQHSESLPKKRLLRKKIQSSNPSMNPRRPRATRPPPPPPNRPHKSRTNFRALSCTFLHNAVDGRVRVM